MSHFIYYYAECHYAEVRYAEGRYAECRSAPGIDIICLIFHQIFKNIYFSEQFKLNHATFLCRSLQSRTDG